MADIFISYSRYDSEHALRLAEELRANGMNVWIDQHGIEAATSWSKEIAEALEACSTFLILLSPRSVTSENVVKELAIAAKLRKQIVPVQLERVELKGEFLYHLTNLQRVVHTDVPAIVRGIEGRSSTVRASTQTPQPQESSTLRIAVLPFEDQSPSHDHEWFSDGLTDELISTLNKLEALLVLDRNSTRAFRNAQLTTKQIARELQVHYVVLGAVRKAGEKIRVQASLIEPESGKVLWDEKFNGTMDDIFEIQEKTARDIVEGLKITLTPAESRAIDEKLTDSPEAYELMMQASRKFNEERDYFGGMRLAERAREIDPKSAAVLYLISLALSNRYRQGNRSDQSLLERERATVRELMQIAPESHYCYIARANYYLNIDETSLSVEMAERAVAVRPKRAGSHAVLGFVYQRVHRHADAVVAFRRALELDPGSGSVHVSLLTTLFTAGAPLEELRAEYPNVKRYLEVRLAEYPNAQAIRMALLSAAIEAQMADDAVAQAEVVLSGNDVDPDTEYCCAEAFVLSGDLERGRAHLRSAIDRGQDVFSVYDRNGFRALEGTPEYDFLVAHVVEELHG